MTAKDHADQKLEKAKQVLADAEKALQAARDTGTQVTNRCIYIGT